MPRGVGGINPIVRPGYEVEVAVGMLVWRVHRTLTTVKLLVHESLGQQADPDDAAWHLVEFASRARGIARELIDAVNAGEEWGGLSYRLVDAVTAIVGLASYLRAWRRWRVAEIEQVWRVLEDTLVATRELARRARPYSLEASILLTVESALHSSRRLRRVDPPSGPGGSPLGDP